MLRSIKIRLYPNKEQDANINKTFGSYRFVYNHMLAIKQEAYKRDKTNLGLCELSKYFYRTLRKCEQYAFLKYENTSVMCQAIRQMLTAYDKFFKQHNGFPKFKSKKDKQSALFSSLAISKRNTFETRNISLTKPLKNIKFRCSDLYLRRLQKYNKNIKSATLSKTKSGKYFLSINVEMEDTELKRFEHTDKQVGIDLGVKDFVITSDGEAFENKHFLKKVENKMKRLQRQLSRKVKGSNNREKQRVKFAKLYERMTNKKEAYINHVVNELLKSYDTIFMEDLNINGMLKNHSIAKAIKEVGFTRLKQVLTTKALANDKQVVFVDRFYPSSKTCNKCGYLNNDLKLSDRSWVCPKCGTKHDRDINAAVNILLEGKRMLATD